MEQGFETLTALSLREMVREGIKEVTGWIREFGESNVLVMRSVTTSFIFPFSASRFV